jgi:uncharacterized protein involved in response to NO
VADDFVWRLFLLLQFAALARISGAVLQALQCGAAATAVIAAAAVGWAAVAVAWAWRYGRWYGTPRPDGRAG